MSGYSEKSFSSSGGDADLNNFIHKPFNPERLLEKVSNLLGLKIEGKLEDYKSRIEAADVADDDSLRFDPIL